MQHAPITTPITDKLASMPWIRWFRQLVDRVEEIKGTADAPAWETITGKPDEFPPEPHTHSQYLTEETDPTVPAHVKDITEEQIAQWGDAATDEEVQQVADDLAALAARATTLSGDVIGSGAENILTTVAGIRGQAVPTPTAGFLRWNGTAWVFVEGDLPETAGLNDLSDVTLATPAENDALEFRGGEWVNRPSFYEHIQTSPAVAWVVANPFGRAPAGITVIDASGQSIGCKIEHDTIEWSFFTVTHSSAIAGRVIFA